MGDQDSKGRAMEKDSGDSSRTGAGRLWARIRAGHFVTVLEARPPDGASAAPLRTLADAVRGRVDAIHLTDAPQARPHLGNLAGAVALLADGHDVVVSRTCRDRNRIGLQGDLLAMAAIGVRQVFFVRGDPPERGDHPEARPVYDVDATGLVRLARRLVDEGRFESGRGVDPAPRFAVAAGLAPEAGPERGELDRAVAKVEAGVDFFVSQPLFDLDAADAFVAALEDRVGAARVPPIVAGVALLDGPAGLEALRAIEEIRVSADVARTLTGPDAHVGAIWAAALCGRIADRPWAAGVALYPFSEDLAVVTEGVDRVRAAVPVRTSPLGGRP